jgi:hypothetical protein
MAAGDAATSESTKMMAAPITYTYDGASSDLTAPAASWFFAPGTVPSTEQIAALAAALGVQGDVQSLTADQGGGWMVGPSDYSQPTVNVASDALQSWWYSAGNSAAVSTPACELYPPGDPAATQSSDPATSEVAVPRCEEPQPPANVPDQATAEAKARDLFAALGIDLGSYQLETYADDWSAGVTGYLVLDGMRTNMTISVGYGAEGALTWASGFLATPQRGADYPRIGIEAAVQRLNDQSASWMGIGIARDASTMEAASTGGGVAVPDTAIAPPPIAPDASAVPGSDVPVSDVPVNEVPVSEVPPTAVIEPAPVDTIAVEPINVSLTAVKPSLEQLWASDGTVWLLPGYAFDAADGGLYTVIAVEDQYIQVVQPPLATDVATSGAATEPAVAPAGSTGAETPTSDG